VNSVVSYIQIRVFAYSFDQGLKLLVRFVYLRLNVPKSTNIRQLRYLFSNYCTWLSYMHLQYYEYGDITFVFEDSCKFLNFLVVLLTY